MSPGRWLRSIAALVGAAALVAAAAGPARAAYQASADANTTAFSLNCIGFNDAYPARMLSAALGGYANLGYTTTAYSGTAFSKTQVLSRTLNDWGFYVHSHGDNYAYSGSTRDFGFREDAGICSGARIIFARDISAVQRGRTSNLVIMSTCHLGESATTMPGAFAITKTKAGWGAWAGPSFYLGYLGEAWDSDEYAFETRFWSAIGPGYGVGQAFDVARLGSFNVGFAANWYGSYVWTGRAGPLPSGCASCL
jgi:hypothetical protein